MVHYEARWKGVTFMTSRRALGLLVQAKSSATMHSLLAALLCFYKFHDLHTSGLMPGVSSGAGRAWG